ncbi:MAG: DUF488 domain-containing protein [Desulfotomaculales bacterium]
MISIYTIGFSKKSLREFITRLKNAGVRKVIDVRLHNTSQLAGYAKKEDLEYVLELAGIAYEHRPELAPTEELLKGYKNGEISWPEYEKVYKDLLAKREPLKSGDFERLRQEGPVCLLCAEDKPDRCHRRLLAEYCRDRLPEVEIGHL